jgi:hypothetical protein
MKKKNDVVHRMQTGPGDQFSHTATRAKEMALHLNASVVFTFNEVECFVNSETDTTLLYRDYENSFLMEWKTVGPTCDPVYSKEIQEEIDKKRKEKEERDEKWREEYNRKATEKKNRVLKKIESTVLSLKDESGWNKSVEVNKDGYGKCVIDYADTWAKLMQEEISKGSTVDKCAEECSHEADIYGITGFMYGCAVGLLSEAWEHGEHLRVWHNSKHNHNGNGVVNPAVLTIKK